MSLALYRRYRPESFAEVIGQEHVTDPLQQALRNNRVNHAYLFSGPRGCGKTTSARILARCLNCEQGPTPNPCGECRSCLDLARNGPGSIDVIEIDAASHGGVDDARDLREKAFFGPASSRYKIYIIDEAHMVTPAGFNALLKVVEEPPEHLKFIFATTEPEKVIGTIRSRTHHYPFRLVPPGTLRDYLAEVCGREQIKVEDGVYPLVVRAGAGSVRDSMSVMDQLLAGAGEDGVTYTMATALLGYTDSALLDDVVDAFASGDGAAVFEIVDRVIEGGHDPRRFVADLLERLRDLVVLAAVPDAGEKGLIDAPADRVEIMQAQASVFGAAELSRAADLVSTGLTEMRGATSPRLQLELICARVLLPGAYDDERSLQARLDKLERRAALGGGLGGAAGAPAAPAAYPQAAAPAAYPQAVPPVPQPAGPAVPDGGRPAGPPAQAAPAPAAAQAAGAGPEAGQDRRPGAWPGSTGGAAGTAPAARRPGSWPTAGGPGQGGPVQASDTPGQTAPVQAGAPAQAGASAQAAGRPGAWPTAAPVGGGQPGGAAAHTVPSPSAGPSQAASPGGDAAPTAGAREGAARVRQLWPDLLQSVAGIKRVTWILLQQTQVVGFDGSTLQVGFEHAGARDGFVRGGHDEVLRQAVRQTTGADWRIDCIVDPGGAAGGSAGPGPAGGAGFGGAAGHGGPGPGAGSPGGGGFGGGGFGGGRPAPAQSADHRPADRAAPDRSAPQTSPASPPQGPRPAERPGPPAPVPVSPEDDIPEEDDPDLVDSALTGHELIVRELGATVIEEIPHQ
ncbi:DNA polymerase III subunit gamma and tau [Streptomyces sp. SCUT-3]|uniref:DNA polymerase III subunit gamma and tau n=1 Tax=Streptomyces TaxID=1883 RepID=UPI0015FB4FC9|nr:DNA polymerase III subunit gamma and tau [Streptomyces sp. SCUT-3]QMV22604.1 DNA polymerase III subunit gamma and tau [Streptomyces sp. SCUT-3]